MRRYSLPLVVVASIVLAALLTWLVVSSANFGGRGPRPEAGPARSEAAVRALPPFTRLDVSGTADVVLVQGAAESVAVAAGGRRAGQVDAQVRNGTLYIEAVDRTRWWDRLFGGGGRPTHVVVTFRELSQIDAAGTVKLSAASLRAPSLRVTGAGGTEIRIDDLQAGKLELAGAGALKAELAGSVAEQTIAISGAGEYRGARLASDIASVTVAGAGKVVVHARKSLDAAISGAGSVEYLGDPTVTEHISGIGRVRRRDA
ncbi:MAG: head GIN domain-containing protein [Burkholderiales bacterium]